MKLNFVDKPEKQTMRRQFFIELEKQMGRNKKIYSITGDLGFPFFDRIAQRFPDRHMNVGAAEQAGLDICVGLAMSGKVPFFYSITPFAILRPFETIRTYLNHERIPVKIIGSGFGWDYSLDGFSTCAPDMDDILKPFTKIELFKPRTPEELPRIIRMVITNDKPCIVIIPRKDRIQKMNE